MTRAVLGGTPADLAAEIDRRGPDATLGQIDAEREIAAGNVLYMNEAALRRMNEMCARARRNELLRQAGVLAEMGHRTAADYLREQAARIGREVPHVRG